MKDVHSQRAHYATVNPLGQDWLNQLFAGKSARNGGIVRRSITDVEREIGGKALELEVRRRGYHLLRSGSQYVIICRSDPVIFIC